MAFLSHHVTYPIRSANPEPQWAPVHDDFFSQYIDTNSFEFGTTNTGPSSLDEDSKYIAPKTLWNGNSFDIQDIYEPSPTFNPWMAGETDTEYKVNTNESMEFQRTIKLPTLHNNHSGSSISYNPTLAPSQTEEMMASELNSWATPISPYYVATEPRSPKRDLRTPSPPRTPPSPRRHRRTPSSSSSKVHSRKSSGQHSPRCVSKSGFVNYTASDSEKLLTGVAPSGSGKTKARREKEAAEKRRRFNHAAVRAVVEAGGNLAKLRDLGVVLAG